MFLLLLLIVLEFIIRSFIFQPFAEHKKILNFNHFVYLLCLSCIRRVRRQSCCLHIYLSFAIVSSSQIIWILELISFLWLNHTSFLLSVQFFPHSLFFPFLLWEVIYSKVISQPHCQIENANELLFQ